jgi:hypothetical protein
MINQCLINLRIKISSPRSFILFQHLPLASARRFQRFTYDSVRQHIQHCGTIAISLNNNRIQFFSYTIVYKIVQHTINSNTSGYVL